MKRGLFLLGLSLFTWGIGEGMFYYLQPLYLQQLGASPVVIGGLLGAMGIAMAVAHIPAGYLSDRVGPQILLVIAWITALLATGVMAFAPGLTWFVAGMLIYGVTAFVASPLNSYVTAARGQWSVGRALTVIMAFYNSGAIIGPMLGGIIGSTLGLKQVYMLSACIFVISTLIIVMVPHATVESTSSETGRSKFPWSSRYFIFLTIAFLVLFSTYLPQPLSSNYLQNYHHLNFQQVGLLGSIASAGIVLMGLVFGRFNPQRSLLAAQLMMGLFTLILWQGTGMAWFALGYFLLGGYRIGRAMLMAQTRSMVQSSQVGLAYGITETVNSVAIILAPILAGYLYNQNVMLVYPVSLTLIALSFVVSIFFEKLKVGAMQNFWTPPLLKPEELE